MSKKIVKKVAPPTKEVADKIKLVGSNNEIGGVAPRYMLGKGVVAR
jgi:hypothetical protein